MRQFDYDGHTWQAAVGGLGLGVGFGDKAGEASHWEARFTCLTDPAKSSVNGLVHDTDLANVSDAPLRRALARALRRVSSQ